MRLGHQAGAGSIRFDVTLEVRKTKNGPLQTVRESVYPASLDPEDAIELAMARYEAYQEVTVVDVDNEGPRILFVREE